MNIEKDRTFKLVRVNKDEDTVIKQIANITVDRFSDIHFDINQSDDKSYLNNIAEQYRRSIFFIFENKIGKKFTLEIDDNLDFELSASEMFDDNEYIESLVSELKNDESQYKYLMYLYFKILSDVMYDCAELTRDVSHLEEAHKHELTALTYFEI